jgi:hypothetical protein
MKDGLGRLGLDTKPHLNLSWDIVDASGKKVSYDHWEKGEMVEQSTSPFHIRSRVWTFLI